MAVRIDKTPMEEGGSTSTSTITAVGDTIDDSCAALGSSARFYLGGHLVQGRCNFTVVENVGLLCHSFGCGALTPSGRRET